MGEAAAFDDLRPGVIRFVLREIRRTGVEPTPELREAIESLSTNALVTLQLRLDRPPFKQRQIARVLGLTEAAVSRTIHQTLQPIGQLLRALATKRSEEASRGEVIRFDMIKGYGRAVALDRYESGAGSGRFVDDVGET